MSIPAWVVEDHHCADCDLSYPALTVAAALELSSGHPHSSRPPSKRPPSKRWRTRPDSQTWSVTEYACHIRDVCATSTIRLYRARTETDPLLEPMLNDLRATRFRYNDLELAGVLTELANNATGLVEEASRNESADWQRTASRQPGETRTALWLLRQAAHEGCHHAGDIATVGSSLGEQGEHTARDS